MTFGRFHFIAGNFLMIRCKILNFKNFDFILIVKKYSVCRFVPSPVRVLDKFVHGERFFSPYGKNLSPCGKFNDSDAKHNHCLYSGWRIYRTARVFYRMGRKISRRAGTCPGQVPG
jgi:hypothetical protein